MATKGILQLKWNFEFFYVFSSSVRFDLFWPHMNIIFHFKWETFQINSHLLLRLDIVKFFEIISRLWQITRHFLKSY